jgi:hypothetical protein
MRELYRALLALPEGERAPLLQASGDSLRGS